MKVAPSRATPTFASHSVRMWQLDTPRRLRPWSYCRRSHPCCDRGGFAPPWTGLRHGETVAEGVREDHLVERSTPRSEGRFVDSRIHQRLQAAANVERWPASGLRSKACAVVPSAGEGPGGWRGRAFGRTAPDTSDQPCLESWSRSPEHPELSCEAKGRSGRPEGMLNEARGRSGRLEGIWIMPDRRSGRLLGMIHIPLGRSGRLGGMGIIAFVVRDEVRGRGGRV